MDTSLLLFPAALFFWRISHSLRCRLVCLSPPPHLRQGRDDCLLRSLAMSPGPSTWINQYLLNGWAENPVFLLPHHDKCFWLKLSEREWGECQQVWSCGWLPTAFHPSSFTWREAWGWSALTEMGPAGDQPRVPASHGGMWCCRVCYVKSCWSLESQADKFLGR